MATKSGWIIGEYTGDPYKDVKITFNNAGSLTAASLCTVTVTGAVLGIQALGTTSAADIYISSSTTEHAAGSVIFTSGATSSVLFHYTIFHAGIA